MRYALGVGQKKIINEPLVSRDCIMFLSVYIKLGLMKQFVKVLDKKVLCFKHICKMFPFLSIDKLKAGILNGPQIPTLIKNYACVLHITTAE